MQQRFNARQERKSRVPGVKMFDTVEWRMKTKPAIHTVHDVGKRMLWAVLKFTVSQTRANNNTR
jgi:hypothetical protein